MSATEAATTVLSADELGRVAALMRGRGARVGPNLYASLIAGGRSNLTYRLDDGRAQWVLRMPPRVGRTPSAHDVAREFRVMAAIHGSGVPVARPLLLCEDERVLGAPFVVAGFVDGRAIRTRSELDSMSGTQVDAVVDSMLGSLVALHRVDHRAVGLESFGRPTSYAARQIRRWGGQWEIVGTPEHSDAAREVLDALSDKTPEQPAVAIVHGDFRVDNTLIAQDLDGRMRVAAVVDWELSTIGDPVADVAMMCAYRHRVFDRIVGEPSAWTSDRLPDVGALTAAYEGLGGAVLDHWDFHLGLAYLKVAVIAAGISHRQRMGAGSGAGYETAGASVGTYLDLARESLSGC